MLNSEGHDDFKMLLMSTRHNRRRSNDFEDARFWFCPNLITFVQTASPTPTALQGEV